MSGNTDDIYTTMETADNMPTVKKDRHRHIMNGDDDRSGAREPT
ncbi:hypothetical protein [Chamaesiphon sp. OTE_20_metabat_361]|nr:hypothetical protein [Chamaesiphon sp. OTE_20_metabat_361]